MVSLGGRREGGCVRTLYIAFAIVGAIVPLLAQAPPPPSDVGSQAPAVPPERGVLGPVDALGQEFRRPAAPTTPAPRLPDGTIDLGDGIWVGGGTGIDLTLGLKPGETLPLLPLAEQLMAARARIPTDDPFLWCLPMAVTRATPYPFRFVQNYTHQRPTHLFILQEATVRTYRQVFMDGRGHPDFLDPTWFRALDRVVGRRHARHRHGGVQRQVLVRPAGNAAHRATAHDRAVDAGRLGTHGQ